MAGIPRSHDGLIYNQFLAQLSQKRRTRRYLEIGVSQGRLLVDMPAQVAVGVDPSFNLVCNVANSKRVTTLVQATSDEFFAEQSLRAALGGPPDFSFLDGLHLFEYLLRDFYNTEQMSTPASLIGMHDCLPLDEKMASRSFHDTGKEGSRFPFWWTGDVWKIVPILNEYRPDLRVVCVNCHPTGIVFVTNLDPTSTVLKDKYLEIVQRYRLAPNNEKSISEFYDNIQMVDAAEVLNEFDQSLFFRS